MWDKEEQKDRERKDAVIRSQHTEQSTKQVLIEIANYIIQDCTRFCPYVHTTNNLWHSRAYEQPKLLTNQVEYLLELYPCNACPRVKSDPGYNLWRISSMSSRILSTWVR